MKEITDKDICSDCGHKVMFHSDIGTYKMSQYQKNYPWCVTNCNCTLSYDDFYYGDAKIKVM